MKITLLVNPSSGRARGRARGMLAARLLRKGGGEVDVVETVSFAHTVDEAAAARAAGVDVVVAVGGDGTANAVAKGLYRLPASDRPPMGLIPSGRGNDFAASLGISDLEAACSALLRGKRRRVDVGRTDGGIFLGVAGAGFDSQVARRAQKGLPLLSGSAAYVYSVVSTLRTFRPITARISHDAGVYEGLITFVAVGNTDRYGGGMRITPHASIDDGLLDLCLVKEISRATLLRLLPSVFRGAHLEHPQVFYTKTKSANIETEEPADLFADGEFIQPVPARIDIDRLALEVITPR